MRAALALAMLAGFFVLAVAVFAGFGGVAVTLFQRGEVEGGALVACLALVLGGPPLVAMAIAVWVSPKPEGVALTRETHPALWQHVDELARIAGTRGPDDIRLVAHANASVWERHGTRYLELGLPFVAGMCVGELRSVLAHELGHFGGGHTKTSALTYRALLTLRLTAQRFDTLGLLYAWARLYALVAASESRKHEQFADEVAVAAAGREAAARAMLRIGPISEAWDDYLQWYVSLAAHAGRTPPLLDGFRSYLDHPRRVHRLRELEPVLAEQEPVSVFDSHPPVRERVAAMRSARPSSVVADAVDERPARALLEGTAPEEVADLVRVSGPPVSWEELATTAGPALLRWNAEKLRHAGRVSRIGDSLAAVLTGLEQGRLHDLTGRPVDASLTTEQVHDAAVRAVTELLACAVADQLVSADRATPELNWGGMFVLRLPDGAAVYPDDLVAPAVRDANQVALVRQRLRAIGVDGV
ncbi:M48 family metalloprotease [Lentzea sp. NPDC059081]|uniref:M48 family metallopeptidase n=1 Tax=Lentzea sp. NPDC059081 TaxID=3346719 RepID=UPI003687D04D